MGIEFGLRRALSSIQELIEIIFEHRHSLRIAFSKFIQEKTQEELSRSRAGSLKQGTSLNYLPLLPHPQFVAVRPLP